MPLNLTEKNFFACFTEQQKKPEIKPLNQLSIEEYRATSLPLFQTYAGEAENVSCQDIIFVASDGYPLSAKIFNCTLPNSAPVLLFYPACGYTLDLFETNAIVVSRLAKHLNIKIILIKYRLAPDFPLARCIQDGFDAFMYLVQHADYYSLNQDQLSIGGISSGANCAALITNQVCENKNSLIKYQILISGIFDFNAMPHGYEQYEAEDKLLTIEAKQYINQHLGLSAADRINPNYSPLFATSLKNLPTTIIFVAEYDGLRGDSEAYNHHLLQAGVDVRKEIFPGQTHNTILLRKALSEGLDPCQHIANYLTKQDENLLGI